MKSNVRFENPTRLCGLRRWALSLGTFALLFAGQGIAHAFSCASTGSGLWSAPGSWTTCNSTIPTTTDAVTIKSGHTITFNFNATITSMTILNGGRFLGDATGRTLTINPTAGMAAIAVNPTGVFTANTSSISINSDAAVTLTSGFVAFNNLTLAPTLTANRIYTMGTTSITVTGNFLINPPSGAFSLTVNMSTTVVVLGTTTVMRGGTATSALNTTASNHTLITGWLNVPAGGTFTSNNSSIFLTGSSGPLFTRGGTFNHGASTVLINSDATMPQLVNGATAFYNLVLSPTLTTNRAYTFPSGALAIMGDLTLLPDKTTAGTATLTVNLGGATTLPVTKTVSVDGSGNATAILDTVAGSNWAINAGFINLGADGTLNANNATITLGGTSGTLFTQNGLFDPDGSTVIMNPNASITTTAGNPITFYNLTFSPPLVTTGKTYTLGTTSTSVNGAFLINPTATALQLTVNLSSAVVVIGTTTVQRASTATSLLDTTASNHALTTGWLNVATGGTFTANNSTLTLTGSGLLFTRAGTFNHGASTVLMTPDVTSTALTSGATGFFNLILAPTLTADRAYTFGTAALAVNGDFTIIPEKATAGTAVLTVNLGGATTVGASKTLLIGGTGNANTILKTTGSNYAITTGRLDIDTNGTLEANASLITLNGPSGPAWVNDGTFTYGTSTVTLSTDGDLTLTSAAATFYNLNLAPTITSTRTYTFGNNVTVLATLTVNPTKSTAGNSNLVVNLGGAMTMPATSSATFTGTTNGRTLFDTVAGSNYPMSLGRLNLAANAALTANDSVITFIGTTGPLFTRAGTFNQGTSHIVMTPDGTMTLVSGTATFYDLTLSPTLTTSRTYGLGASPLTVNGALTIDPTSGGANALTVNLGASVTTLGATVVDGAGSATTTFDTVTGTNALTTGQLQVATPGTFKLNRSTLTLTGSVSPLLNAQGTFNVGNGLIRVTADADATLSSGVTTINALELNPTLTADRAYTMASDMTTINGAWTLSPIKATGGNAILTVTMQSPVTVPVASSVTVSGVTNGYSRLDTGADKNLTAGKLLLNTNGTFVANGSTVTLTSTASTLFTRTGVFASGTSNTVFNPDAAVTLTSGVTEFYLLTLSPTLTASRVYTLGAGALTIDGDLLIDADKPTVGAASLTLNLGAGTTVYGDTTITGTGNATGILNTVSGSNFAFSSGRIDIDTPGTLTAQAAVISLTGSSGVLLNELGSFVQGTSTVSFAADADVTLTAGTLVFTNLLLNPTLTANRAYTFGSSVLTVNGAFTSNPVKTTGGNATLTTTLGAATTVISTSTLIISGTTNGYSNLDTGANWALTAGRLDIQANGALTTNASTITLTAITGVLMTESGTFHPDASTVMMTPDATVTLTSGSFDFYNLKLNPTITLARTYTFGAGQLGVLGDLTVIPDAASGLRLLVNMGAPMGVNHMTSITRTGSAISSMTTTASNYWFGTDNLSIGTSGSFVANGSSLTVSGATGPLMTVAGPFAAHTSTVAITTPSSLTINAGTATFCNLLINTPGQTQTLGNTLGLTGALTVNNGTLADGGYQITGNATYKFNLAAGAGLSIGSATVASTFPTNYTAANTILNAASTVTYNAGVSQTISGTPTYGYLHLLAPSGTPTKTLAAATTVSSDLWIGTNNTLSVGASSLGLTVGGDYQNDGTFTANLGTVTFNGASHVSSLSGTMTGSSAFGYLTFNGSSSQWTLNNPVTVGSTLTVTAGSLLGAQDVTVNGGVVGNGTNGLINLSGGTFEQRVAANQLFGTNAAGANGWTFNNLTFSNSSASNRIVTTNATGSGAINVNGTLTIGQTGDTNTTTLNNATNGRLIDANDNLTITSKGVLQASSQQVLTVGGDWTNNGTFTTANSTVAFDGGNVQTLSGSTTFYGLRALVSGTTLQFTSGTTQYASYNFTLQNVTLRSETNGATWYLALTGSSQTLTAVRVRDSNATLGQRLIGNAASVSLGNNTKWDLGAPSRILNLAANVSATGSGIDLTWSATGENSSFDTLYNSSFTVQYTTDTVFGQGNSWSASAAQPAYVFRVVLGTTAVAAGANQGATLTGLTGSGTYYFRMWTVDASSNVSTLSNGATNWITPVVLGVQMSTDVLTLGALTPGTTNVISSSITITNTGNVPQRYQLTITEPAVWRSTHSGAGIDTFRLTGLFRTATPNSSDFDPVTDVVTSTPTLSGTNTFAVAGDPDAVKGVLVPPGEERYLWFRIEAPPISSTTTQQSIRVDTTASQ